MITALQAKTPEGYLYETHLDKELLTSEGHVACDFAEVQQFLSSSSSRRDPEALALARVIVAEAEFADEIERLFRRFLNAKM